MSAVGAEGLEVLFEDLLTEVNSLLYEIQQDINELAAELSEAMRWLPLPVTVGIRWAWDRFLTQANRIFDEVQKFIGQPGFPPALFRLGGYWDLQVGTPVSGVRQAVSADGTTADDRWTGSAAAAYGDSADAQARAVTAIKPLVERIQHVLSDVAWGIISFWAGMAAAVVTFAVGVTAAVGLVASPVGAPAAPVDAGATATVVVGLITSVVLVSVAYMETRSTSLATVQQALNDHGGLVRQGSRCSWPRADSTTDDGTGRWRFAD